MGVKGDKNTQTSNISAEYLMEKLSSIGGISSKKMFGGHGIFHESKMFGIIDSKGGSFLKVDDSNKTEFKKRGAQRHSKMPYYSIPEDILENQTELIKWANKAIEISK